MHNKTEKSTPCDHHKIELKANPGGVKRDYVCLLCGRIVDEKAFPSDSDADMK